LEQFHANRERFDLVITDQSMPGMNGDDLAREVRRIRADIPIILCTGYGMLSAVPYAGGGEGCTAVSEVVLKPLVRREMAAAIQRVLARQSTRMAYGADTGN
jgi:CheY-like chemotaxis protein